jgi:serine/threonine protein kinase
VHRDLKPGNIFDDEGVVKIGDYGLSKLISASRRSGQTESVGTFHYMAPEIGRGVYGKGIDIYALGIILYEMLTGRVPFDGETSQEIIMKHLTDNPDTTAVPQPFRAVIQRALRKDPDKRFESVQQMLDADRRRHVRWRAGPMSWIRRQTGRGEPIYIGDDRRRRRRWYSDRCGSRRWCRRGSTASQGSLEQSRRPGTSAGPASRRSRTAVRPMADDRGLSRLDDGQGVDRRLVGLGGGRAP